jgi:hypothetical protein
MLSDTIPHNFNLGTEGMSTSANNLCRHIPTLTLQHLVHLGNPITI